MSTKEQLEQRIERLIRRADRVNADKAKLEKEEAVKLDRYEAALAQLKGTHKIDASEMTGAQLRNLLAETEAELQKELDTWEETVAKAEQVIQDFKELQA